MAFLLRYLLSEKEIDMGLPLDFSNFPVVQKVVRIKEQKRRKDKEIARVP